MNTKILKGFAALALCGAVAATANADVQSANICGYQNIDIVPGYKFFTVTFENIADSTKFNLSDIKCTKVDGSAWLRTGAAANACNGAIYVQKIDAEGSYGQEYIYYGKNASDTFGPGWYVGTREADGGNLVVDDSITLKPGEGLIVYSGKNAKFQVAGGVKLEPMTNDISTGYSFGGNSTPVTLNLADVKIKKPDGSDWLRTGAAANACNGAIYIQKIDAEGSYGQEYIYYGKNASDTFGPGWYVGTRAADGSNLITGDMVTFAPGEGWIMYSGKSAKIEIPSALKK